MVRPPRARAAGGRLSVSFGSSDAFLRRRRPSFFFTVAAGFADFRLCEALLPESSASAGLSRFWESFLFVPAVVRPCRADEDEDLAWGSFVLIFNAFSALGPSDEHFSPLVGFYGRTTSSVPWPGPYRVRVM